MVEIQLNIHSGYVELGNRFVIDNMPSNIQKNLEYMLMNWLWNSKGRSPTNLLVITQQTLMHYNQSIDLVPSTEEAMYRIQKCLQNKLRQKILKAHI